MTRSEAAPGKQWVIAGAWHAARLSKTLETLSTGLVVPGIRATLPFSTPFHKYGVGTGGSHNRSTTLVFSRILRQPPSGAPTKPSRRHHSGPVRIRDLIYETQYLEREPLSRHTML